MPAHTHMFYIFSSSSYKELLLRTIMFLCKKRGGASVYIA